MFSYSVEAYKKTELRIQEKLKSQRELFNNSIKILKNISMKIALT